MSVNPSTYKQVIDNMAAILAAANNITTIQGQIKTLNTEMGDLSNLPMNVQQMAAIVDELNTKILQSPVAGDVKTTDDGMKVLGTHVNTANADTDTLIATYSQGATFELKKISAIGLTGKTGMDTGTYCFVLTLKKDLTLTGEPNVLDYKPEQVAFAPGGMYFYSRLANTDGSWGEWRAQDKVRTQYVSSDTEPTDQLENEYWSEPITTT